MTDRNKGILFALSAAVIWGFLAILLKIALVYLPAMTIVWLRFTLAFIFLGLILFFKDRKALEVVRRPPLLGIVAALALAFNYTGYIKGLDLTTPSNAQVVIQLAPLLLIVAGLVIYKERISKQQGFGFILALLGFVVFYRDQIGQLIGSADNYNQGIIWVTAAALSWVVFASLQKLLVQKHHAQGLNLLIYLVPSLILIPMVEFESMLTLSWSIWLLVLLLGISTILAYGAIAEAFKLIPANKVGAIATLNPILTISSMAVLTAMGVSWIDPERISIYGFLGAALILLGVVIAIAAQGRTQLRKTIAKGWRLGLKRE